MFGRYSGATPFLSSYMSYAIPILCIAHEEALAVARDISEPIAENVDLLMKWCMLSTNRMQCMTLYWKA